MGEVGCLKDGHFQNLQVEGTIVGGSGLELQETMFAKSTRTALTETLVTQLLVKNSFNTVVTPNPSSGSDFALTLPAQADSQKGDFIHFDLIGDMSNSDVLKIGTAGEFFAIGSKLHVVGEDDTRLGRMDFSDATDDFLNITCTTNGDGGIGTNFHCYFNGSNWGINCVVYGEGTRGAVSSTETKFHTS